MDGLDRLAQLVRKLRKKEKHILCYSKYIPFQPQQPFVLVYAKMVELVRQTAPVVVQVAIQVHAALH